MHVLCVGVGVYGLRKYIDIKALKARDHIEYWFTTFLPFFFFFICIDSFQPLLPEPHSNMEKIFITAF